MDRQYGAIAGDRPRSLRAEPPELEIDPAALTEDRRGNGFRASPAKVDRRGLRFQPGLEAPFSCLAGPFDVLAVHEPGLRHGADLAPRQAEGPGHPVDAVSMVIVSRAGRDAER